MKVNLEKQSRANQNGFRRGLGLGVGSNVLQTFLSFALIPVYLKFLGVEGYGLVGLYSSFLVICGILDVALSSSVSREISWITGEDSQEKKLGRLIFGMEKFYWLILIAASCPLLVIVGVFDINWLNYQNLDQSQVRQSLVLMITLVVIQVPVGLYSATLIGLHKQGPASLVVGLFVSLRHLATVLALWLIQNDIRVFFLAYLFVSILQVLTLRHMVQRCVGVSENLKANANMGVVREMKNIFGPMLIVTALGTVLSQIDKLLLSTMQSLSIVGWYALAWAIAAYSSMIATPISNGYGARFSVLASQSRFDQLNRELTKATYLLIILVVPPAVIIGLNAEYLLILWTSNPVVADAVEPILPLLLVGSVLVSVIYPTLIAFYATKRFRPVVLVQALCFFVFVPMFYLGIDRFGAIGAAYCWAAYGLTICLVYSSIQIDLAQTDYRVIRLVVSIAVVSLVTLVIFRVINAAVEIFSSGEYILIAIMLSVVIAWLCFGLLWPETRLHIFRFIRTFRLRSVETSD